MIAARVIDTRRTSWQQEQDGKRTRRTMGLASPGGATLDDEESYRMKEMYIGPGAVQVENQARWVTGPPSPVWGPRSVAAAPRRSSRTFEQRVAGWPGRAHCSSPSSRR